VFRTANGNLSEGTLRVRFGEVEARGVAATVRGRAVYDRLTTETERAVHDTGGPVSAAQRADIAAELWNQRVPATEYGLALQDLAYFTFHVNPNKRRNGEEPGRSLQDLLQQGWIRPQPIVYEDFLPKSAAGIFQSNLTSDGHKDTAKSTTALDAEWMAGVLNRPLHDPYELYDGIRRTSLHDVATQLGIHGPIDTPTATQGVN
jgi:uncharacterized glyoxalase superfamily metalloenzyme YdcJ